MSENPIEMAMWRQNRANAQAVEIGCEAALQTGTHGVRVTHRPDFTVLVEVTDEVPYGFIHEILP